MHQETLQGIELLREFRQFLSQIGKTWFGFYIKKKKKKTKQKTKKQKTLSQFFPTVLICQFLTSELSLCGSPKESENTLEISN